MWSQEPTALDVPIHMGALGYGLVKGSDSFAATPTTPLVPLPGMGPTGYPPIGGGPSRKPEDTRFIDDGLKELLAS